MKPAFLCCVALAVVGLAHAASPGENAKAKGLREAASSGKPQKIQIHVFDRNGQLVGPLESQKLSLTRKEWKQKLSSEQFQVLRSKETERPFCGFLLHVKVPGVYTCAACGLPLFSSESKFVSNTGWPSFVRPIAESNVTERIDRSHGELRKEINCARCDGHLGHVFEDGPAPTGRRYCLNSASLTFVPNDRLASLADPLADPAANHQGADDSTKNSVEPAKR